MDFLFQLAGSVATTIKDVLPIVGVVVFFQFMVLKKRIDNLARLGYGFLLVVLGLAFFSVGLDKGLFPLGEAMISQLTDLNFLAKGDKVLLKKIKETGVVGPGLYSWVYIFSFLIGFATTIAEPALIAVAFKAEDISTGSISAWGLRIAVALGVGVGLALGSYRIITGSSLISYIVFGYLAVIIQTCFAPRMIVPLAYDSGGVTTSTVTVPLVAALGIGLASSVPGRSVLIDAFGLIAFASLFPIISVLSYAIIGNLLRKRGE